MTPYYGCTLSFEVSSDDTFGLEGLQHTFDALEERLPEATSTHDIKVELHPKTTLHTLRDLLTFSDAFAFTITMVRTGTQLDPSPKRNGLTLHEPFLYFFDRFSDASPDKDPAQRLVRVTPDGEGFAACELFTVQKASKNTDIYVNRVADPGRTIPVVYPSCPETVPFTDASSDDHVYMLELTDTPLDAPWPVVADTLERARAIRPDAKIWLPRVDPRYEGI